MLNLRLEKSKWLLAVWSWISVERTDSGNTGERDAQASVRVRSRLERCKMKTMTGQGPDEDRIGSRRLRTARMHCEC